MNIPDRQAGLEELQNLKERVAQLQADLQVPAPSAPWRPTGYYTTYFAMAGSVLGMFAAMASLLFNIVGSLFVGQYPLELIRIYLTVPLGDGALEVSNELTMAVGCCLYLGTGMLLGIPFQLVLARWANNAALGARLLIASVLAIVIWLINYYGILAWLQPLIIDMSTENLIVNQVPAWVAALTHLVFGWTMAVLYPLGLYATTPAQAEGV